MSAKIISQLNASGYFLALVEADESPLEPGVFHLPAGCVDALPPESWPEGKWPRWNGSLFTLTAKPKAPTAPDPVQKLADFLAAHPDVAALISQQGQPSNV